MTRPLFSFLLICLAAGCDSKDTADSGAAEADTDTDADADGDTDADADADGDGDTDMDEDTDDEEEADTADTAEEECDDQTDVTLFMSPDDSNSMSSPVQARLAILGGWDSLDNISLRTWEFMNYYSFGYPPAEDDELAITAQLVEGDGLDSEAYVMQIAVSSPQLSNAYRAPMNITFSLDTSGSMSGHPLSMLKESCLGVASKLVQGDVVSMVTWNSSNNVVLDSHQVSGADDATLLSAIDGLAASGSTNLNAGLAKAYELASENYGTGRINRVLLVSDGGANTGQTDLDIISSHAGSGDEVGIYMVGVGVGSANTYHDELMDTVTDQGKGASVFIGDEDEARLIFRERFVNTLAVAARDVAVRLDLPPGFEVLRFSGEAISSDPQEVDPQHIAPNDAMIFHKTIKTCAPELVTGETEVVVTATWRHATSFETHETQLRTSFGELLAQDADLLRKGAAIYKYAEALKAHKTEPGSATWTAALEAWEHAQALAEEARPMDEDLAQVREVMEAL